MRTTSLALMLVSATTLNAQSLNLLGNGAEAGSDTLLERASIRKTVAASFVKTLNSKTADAQRRARSSSIAFESAVLMAEARTDFESELDQTLDQLEGDGLLTFVEVRDELPSLRSKHLERFDSILSAASNGYPPPPMADEYDSQARFHLDMARYTITTRNPPRAWFLLALSILVGTTIASLLSKLLRASARRFGTSERLALAKLMAEIRLPVLLTAGTTGLLVGLDFLWLPTGTSQDIRAVLQTGILILLFWAGWSLCGELGAVLANLWQKTADIELEGQGRLIIQRLLRLLALIAFVLIVTRVVLDASVTGLIAGLGVVGIGLWFLLQGLVENLAASFTLFGDPAFKIGDTVIFQSHWGTIEDIGFRSTRFRTFEGHLLTIPNKLLIDEALHNVSAQSSHRRRFTLSLAQGTSARKLEEAITLVEAVLAERADRQPADTESEVVFKDFGEQDLQILVQYFVDTRDYWEAQRFHDEVNQALLDRLHKAGIELSLPTVMSIVKTRADHPLTLSVEHTTDRGVSAGDASNDQQHNDSNERSSSAN